MQDEFYPTAITTFVDAHGATTLLCVAGEVDVATAPGLRRAGMAEIRAGRRLTVDLAEVTFLDAAGVSALVALHRAAVGAGGAMTVRHTRHRPVALVLDLTRATDILHLE